MSWRLWHRPSCNGFLQDLSNDVLSFFPKPFGLAHFDKNKSRMAEAEGERNHRFLLLALAVSRNQPAVGPEAANVALRFNDRDFSDFLRKFRTSLGNRSGFLFGGGGFGRHSSGLIFNDISARVGEIWGLCSLGAAMMDEI
jgi:hypothetical protein